MKLDGTVVVITGASKGLGRSLAKGFVAEGCKVVISSRDEASITKTAKEVGAAGFATDVQYEDQVIALAEEAVKLYGRIDIWINNAGIWQPYANFEDVDWKRAHNMFETNLFGLVYGSKAALLDMKRRNSGAIINILSTSALRGRPRSTAYAASKWAGRGFSDSLREELKDSGIKILSVYPGGMKTELFNEDPHPEYDKFLDPDVVTKRVIENLKKDSPDTEITVNRQA